MKIKTLLKFKQMTDKVTIIKESEVFDIFNVIFELGNSTITIHSAEKIPIMKWKEFKSSVENNLETRLSLILHMIIEHRDKQIKFHNTSFSSGCSFSTSVTYTDIENFKEMLQEIIDFFEDRNLLAQYRPGVSMYDLGA